METPPENMSLKEKIFKFIWIYKKDLISSVKERNKNTREKVQDPIKLFYNELSCLDLWERKNFFVKRVHQYFIESQEYYLSDEDKKNIKISYKDIGLALSNERNKLNDYINSDNYEWFLSCVNEIKEILHLKLTPYLTLENVIATYPTEKAHSLCKQILESIYPDKKFKKIWTSWYTTVFEEEWWDVVYKLNTRSIIKEMASKFWNIHIKKWRYEIDRTYEKEMFKILEKEEYFSKKWSVLVPWEVTVKDITIPQSFYEEIKNSKKWFKDNQDNKFSLTYTVAPLAKEIKEKKFTSFNFNRNLKTLKKLLWEEVWQDIYNKLEYGNWITVEELKIFLNKRFQYIVSEINNPKVLKDFLQRLIKFSKENNSMIDIFWSDNITFFKDENWETSYHLIDPTFVYPQPLLTDEEANKQKFIDSKNFSKYTFYYLLPIFEKFCKDN